MKRAFITALLIGAATAFVLLIIVGDGGESADQSPPADRSETAEQDIAEAEEEAAPSETSDPAPAAEPDVDRPNGPSPADRTAVDADRPAPVSQAPTANQTPPAESETAAAPRQPPLGELVILEAPWGSQPEPDLGNAAHRPDNPYTMHVKLSSAGAGVRLLELSDYSQRVNEAIPYRLQSANDRLEALPLAARRLWINGRAPTTAPDESGRRYPFAGANWHYVPEQSNPPESATFQITIARAADQQPVLRVTRTYRLEPNLYDLKLEQRITNLSGRPLDVRFEQYGQLDLPEEGGYLGDRRTATMGYFKSATHPREHVFIDGYRRGRGAVANADDPSLWPTDSSIDEGHELTFAAMSNRYFTAVVHAPAEQRERPDGSPKLVATPLSDRFPTVFRVPANASKPRPIGLAMTSDEQKLGVGQTMNLDLGVYAGPKAPDVINENPLYTALGLEKLIIYNIGGCCAPLTFSWLSHGLLAFLKFLHAGLVDWGLAIIVLVLIVRGILHPITKKSQINMQKVGRQMAALQPEMERLKKKYKDEQQKLNQEMMKLYREKGVNPAAMGLGCLPMFLQMPIWIALYAMLFFAIELRHEPAFYGVFQNLTGGKWLFLADLSSPDSFIKFPPISVLGLFTLDSFNILPVLMAVVFFFQQKFMTPPQQNVSEQQQQQQKIMRFAMLLFPIFLYKAPSGLTLYILASTASGILDSYMVRRHIKKEEEAGTLFEKKEKKPPKPGGFMDRMQKAAEAKRAEMEQRQKQLQGKQPQQRRRSGGGSGGSSRRRKR